MSSPTPVEQETKPVPWWALAWLRPLVGFVLGVAAQWLFDALLFPETVHRLPDNGALLGLFGVACGLLGLVAGAFDRDRPVTVEVRLLEDRSASLQRLRSQSAEQEAVVSRSGASDVPSSRGPQRRTEPNDPEALVPSQNARDRTTRLASVGRSGGRTDVEESQPQKTTEGSSQDRSSATRSTQGTLDPSLLVDLWSHYLQFGDGRFDPRGLSECLDGASVDAEVLTAEDLGTDQPVLGIAPAGETSVYLVPDFTRPARAVDDWFVDRGRGERTARIDRLFEVAITERQGNTLQLLKKGTVA